MDQEQRLREDKITGERIYQGRILDFEVDRVRLPSGVEAEREVVRHKGAVVVPETKQTPSSAPVRQ